MSSVRLFGCACAAALSLASQTFAQTVQLPDVIVSAPGGTGGDTTSLTVPSADAARRDLERTPGGVEVIPDAVYKNGQAQTVKDIVDYTPGVWAQPKWGDDTRLSIRGSGLSRNFHLRGTQLYMDGIPINTSDGYGDFHEIDPTASRYVEVYKGANALRYGANALGGAINFVSPTGRDASPFEARFDAGSFGFLREQASSGKAYGPLDYYITGSNWSNDGYRNHSDGFGQRGSANIGYQFTPDIETRFYFNLNHVRQHIPGEVDKATALNTPQKAWTDNVVNDWQRNIDTGRIANKSTVRLGTATVDFGASYTDRHLMHPIFEWLDYRYKDYGAFSRIVNDATLFGFRDRLVAGINVVNGTIHADQFVNTGGNKGIITKSMLQSPENYTGYVENSFFVLPNVALVAGTQYLHAVRKQDVLYTIEGDLSGQATYDLWSPKYGVVWDVTPDAQVFGNVSRSGEAPSFGEGNGTALPFYDIKAQTATTYEIGTRGQQPNFTWDAAIYRANIRNELQCFVSAFGNCNVTNADRTIHQGVEIGGGIAVLKEVFVSADRVWFRTAYTYNDFRYDNDAAFGNNRLPGEPPHYMRSELMYQHPSGLSFGPNVEWAPHDYFVDSANTQTSPSYVLWGAKLVYETKSFTAYVEGRNLANQTYVAATSIIDRATDTTRLYNPGNGRAIFGGMRFAL